ncbi:hypothetical protein MGSAQ_001725 [marine sediment metagenome]|uniref:Uncharacterized protein n=1 Tax=marine sediment metagenome TaxID=412755 RepID=A0A1B6NUZ5_9ZZZZ
MARRLILEAPGLDHCQGLRQHRVQAPQPQQAVWRCQCSDGHRGDLVDRQARVLGLGRLALSLLRPHLIAPGRVGHDKIEAAERAQVVELVQNRGHARPPMIWSRSWRSVSPIDAPRRSAAAIQLVNAPCSPAVLVEVMRCMVMRLLSGRRLMRAP